MYTDAEDKNEKESVSGTVDSVIYSSDETGYTVCEIEDENGLPAVLVGTMPYIAEGDTVTAAGRWTNHPTYGRQFKVEMYEKTLPGTENEILRYLSSGAIHGIGPKTAAKIVERFGEDTFDVMENHPDWLAELPGITLKKARAVSESFADIAGARNVMMFCARGNARAPRKLLRIRTGMSLWRALSSLPHSPPVSFSPLREIRRCRPAVCRCLGPPCWWKW